MVLAHELAHVVQQRGSRTESSAGLVSDLELEAEANWAARRIADGKKAFLHGRSARPAPGGGLGGLLGGLLGGQGAGGAEPGLAPMLDLNGDGNPLDDILRMAGKAIR